MRKRTHTGSLIRQVQEALDSQIAYGQSKHADKLAGVTESKIYSTDTYNTYLRHACDFVSWCKTTHGSRTLEECRPLAPEYIRMLQDAGQSPATLATKANSISKVYRCSKSDLNITTPPRHRAGITRSRGWKPSDLHFSEARNHVLVDFCRGTGLRNHKELQMIRGDQFALKDGQGYIMNVKGKGGKLRNVPVFPAYLQTVQQRCQEAGSGLVWPHVSSHADIHSYRSDYAMAWYQALARPVDEIPKQDRYICRRDMAGRVYDKRAMLHVSRMLGHNRISVIAESYLR